MKTLIAATIALGVLAGPALAAGFPEKAESRVWTSSQNQNFAGDLMIPLPLKAKDRINGSNSGSFGSTHALAVEHEAGSVAPIFSPNR
jgi:hypothetical protein